MRSQSINVKLEGGYEFQGFGTSLAWWAHYLATHANNRRLVEQVCRILYDPLHPFGLHFNIVRYNIGGGKDPSRNEELRLGADVPGYKTSPDGEYKFQKADAGQRWILKYIMHLRPDVYIEAFSNSPPYYMTVSGLVSGHEESGFKCNIRDEKVEDFAIYLADVVEYLVKTEGIPIKSLSPMNEASAFWQAGVTKQEGCNWSISARRRIINYLHEQLKSKNLAEDVIISACDENNMLQGFFGLFTMPWKCVERVNVHSYHIAQFTKGVKTFGIEDWDLFRVLIRWVTKDIKNKDLWMSEWGMGMWLEGQVDFMHIMNGVYLAQQVIRDLVILKPTAWVYWQAVENISDSGWGLVQTQFADGGPSIYLYDFAFQSSLMVQESVVSDQLRLGRQFYAMSHFSRFIKPGYTLLGGRYHYGNISYVSACTPTENEFVFVLVSGRSEETSINLNVETSKESSGVPQGTIYETHGASANLEVSRNVSISRQGTAVKISFQCKPQCIVTLVVLLF